MRTAVVLITVFCTCLFFVLSTPMSVPVLLADTYQCLRRCCADATDFLSRVRILYSLEVVHTGLLCRLPCCAGCKELIPIEARQVCAQSCSCNQYFISAFTAPRGFDAQTMAVGTPHSRFVT